MQTQVIQVDLFKFANGDQSKQLGYPATDFNSVRTALEQFATVSVKGDFSLRAGPSQAKTSVRPEVSASLERSLKEHADIWAELAKR